MTDENIYYVDTSRINMNNTSKGNEWHEQFVESVSFEVKSDHDESLNVTYNAEQITNESPGYETANEEDSQYYSIMETSNDDVDTTLEAINIDVKNQKDNVSANSLTNNCNENDVITSNENITNNELSAEDQVILYRMEGTNEIYAVQAAKDENGQIQKYQYKVRETEDGQFEAVPGTIRLQPEGTNHLICDDGTVCQTVEETNLKNTQNVTAIDEVTESKNLENITEITETTETTETEKIDKINETNSDSNIDESAINEEIYEEEYLEDEDMDEVENFLTTAPINETKKVEIVPPAPAYKVYSPGSKVQVLSNMMISSKTPVHTKNTEASFSKTDQNKIKANIISIVQDKKSVVNKQASNTTVNILNKNNSNLSNTNLEVESVLKKIGTTDKKMTFLILSKPLQVKQKENVLSSKVLIQNSRRVIKPAMSILKSNIKAQTQVSLNKTKTQNVETNTSIIRVMKSEPKVTEIRSPRQPRKQTIKPVERDGSEIIIQAPEEEITVTTYELDNSDEEYSPKSKGRGSIKKKVPKKRGRKPKAAQVVIDAEISITSIDDNEDEENVSVIKKRRFSEENSDSLSNSDAKNTSDVEDVKNVLQSTEILEEDDNIITLDDVIEIKDEFKKEFKSSDHEIMPETSKKVISKEKNIDFINKNKMKIQTTQLRSNFKVQDTKFKCTACPKLFASKKLLESHKVMHKKFKCTKCPEILEGKSKLILHLQTHEKEVEKKEETNSITTEKRRLSIKPQKNPVFGKKILGVNKISSPKFVISRTLRRRTLNKTDIEEIKENAKNNKLKDDKIRRKSIKPTEVQTCGICLKSFNKKSDLIKHRDISHKLSCTNCGKVFSFKNMLDEHIRMHCLNRRNSIRRSMSPKKNLTTKYSCVECNKIFTDIILYKRHKQEHIKQVPSKVTLRAKTQPEILRTPVINARKTLLMSKTPLPVPEQRHSNRKQVPSKKAEVLKCNLCNFTVTTFTALSKHQQSHSGKNFKCNDCKKLFKTAEELSEHLETHVSNMFTKCNVCDKQFNNTEALSKHADETKHLINLDKSVKKVKIGKRTGHSGIPASLKLNFFDNE